MRPPAIPPTIPIHGNDTKLTLIMKTLYNALIEHREPQSNRILIQHFMYLPSRKDFPEYFNIIEKPMSMHKIRDRIEKQHYNSLDEFLADLRLIFNNCRLFNEDESQIYLDSVKLESILDKRREKLLHNDSDKNNHHIDSQTATSNSDCTTIATRHQQQQQNSTSSTNNVTRSSSGNSNANNLSSNNNNLNDNRNNTKNSYINNNNNNNSVPESDSTNDSAHLDNHHNNHNQHHPQQQQQKQQLQHQPNHDHQHHHHHHHQNNTTTNSNTNNNNHQNQYQQRLNIFNSQGQPKQNQPQSLQNGNDPHPQETPRINHDHHNETSMDSSSNLSADLLLGSSTPIEKCSLNKRRGRNPDKEKRLQLTGYIIYASEIRKEVIDKNPNQNFGDISRLVGNEWKALPDEIREKYNDRAKKHNNIVKVGRLSINSFKRDADDNSQSGSHQNGVSTPKLSSRELARRTKEQMRQFHLHAATPLAHDDSMNSSTRVNHDLSPIVSRVPHSSTQKQQQHQQQQHQHQQQQHQQQHQQQQQHSQAQPSAQITLNKVPTTESSTQTSVIRFVEPTTYRKRLAYSETFRKYIEDLQVPHRDLLVEETVPDRPAEVPKQWLGAGRGRHESPGAALWALRDFMLQDAASMRRSLEPYL